MELIEHQNQINQKVDQARVDLAEGVYELCDTVQKNEKKAEAELAKVKQDAIKEKKAVKKKTDDLED